MIIIYVYDNHAILFCNKFHFAIIRTMASIENLMKFPEKLCGLHLFIDFRNTCEYVDPVF